MGMPIVRGETYRMPIVFEATYFFGKFVSTVSQSQTGKVHENVQEKNQMREKECRCSKVKVHTFHTKSNKQPPHYSNCSMHVLPMSDVN